MHAEQPAPRAPTRGRPKISLYLESRYRKLERGLPQTIFYCPECKGHRRRRRNCARCEGFGKLTKDSVQELIGRHVLPAFKAREGKFHGAGREDLDVRMLGEGRPFVYQVCGARQHDVDLEELLARIHQREGERIQLAPLQPVARERVAYWKQAEFQKVYRAEVAFEAEVQPAAVQALVGQALDIVQRTPQRVAHRRADLERERHVEVLRAELLAPDRMAVDMRCAHGTYVKEWISGDDGRTRPSLTDLVGVPARCDVLDVLEVVVDAADGR